MGTVWYCLVASMIAAYVLLDGFDLGVGAIHLLTTRTGRERWRMLETIAPIWDGNEVWLLAAGGTLYFAFPSLYASSFSGFYLPLMIVLWMLILRGVSITFRNYLINPVWNSLCDTVFGFSSALLAFFFGVVLGNVVRGVPLDSSGYFFEPLWTDFRLGNDTGILDWYTILVGVLALAALMMHGCLWVQLKAEGTIAARVRELSLKLWWACAVLGSIVTIVSFRIQPQLGKSFATSPWGLLFPLLTVIGAFSVKSTLTRRLEKIAFGGSCLYLSGMLLSLVFGIYPMVLPARDPKYSLTIGVAAAGKYGLKVGLVWWVLGMILASVYFVVSYRSFSGRVSLEQSSPQDSSSFNEE